MESKHDRFIRLAERRTNDVISKIRLISNLSNRRNYDFNKVEVQEIFNAIEDELKLAKKIFESELNQKQNKFKFSQKKGDINE